LRNEYGNWVEGEEQLKHLVFKYYSALFTSQGGSLVSSFLNQIQPRVTQQMNEMLLADFASAEIKRALDQMGDLKAPGPDGMPAIFYKKCWHIVGERVIKEVLQVLNGGEMPAGWNDTNIILIPKVKNPTELKDFRPISLRNVIYKIVSKVLANRLKKILPDIISSTQSAFVPGRLITDNILVDYEVTQFLRNKKKGKTGYAAVKLDMSKAYDRVEWSFLQAMMRKLGFHDKWNRLILKCVSTVLYKIRVNNEYTKTISPGRGLRQGDPLSPYLFVICAEVSPWRCMQLKQQEELWELRFVNKLQA